MYSAPAAIRLLMFTSSNLITFPLSKLSVVLSLAFTVTNLEDTLKLINL